MFKHSLLLTYRNFKRFKSSFFINLVGLSTGLACSLFIYLWVNDELSVDKFHEKDNRLYRVMEQNEFADGIELEEGTPGLLAKALADEMPEVEYAATVVASSRNRNLMLSVEDKNIRATGWYVGKDYFNMFSFPLILGDKDEVLADKTAIVISEELALRLFNSTENLIGKPLMFQHEKEYFISGVFKSPPANSSQQFDFVLSYESFLENNPWMLEWGNSGPDTYLTLKEGTNSKLFNDKIAGFLNTKGDHSHRTLFINPFSDYYLYSKYENGQQVGGRIVYVKLFSIVAIFILLIACINFMNLSTAKATRRLKEVGIKKSIGASRRTLIFQYLGESVLMAFLSLIMAIIFVVLILPAFNEITGKQLTLHFDTTFVLMLIGITFLTGLLSGSYPAIYLSGFNPISILKGGASSHKSNTSIREVWARKGLVVFQFSLSIILIVAVLVVYKQIEFVQNKNLGYNKNNVIYFMREGNLGEKLEAFLLEVNKLPGIINASSADNNLIGHDVATSGVDWEGKASDFKIEFERIDVNLGLMETLDIEMAEGRFFSKDYGAENKKIILNEAAVKVMGINDPIGKVMKLWGEERQIIGVTSDFHFRSLHEQVRPVFFRLEPQNTWMIMAKIEAGKEQETIAKLQTLYATFNPGFPFVYNFLDDDYQAQYEAEQRVSVLSRYFAGIAILISCLGLYGLVAFAAEQRRKEIGIRKVLGASVSNIMALLSKDFIKLVSISIVVGSAVSWIAMSKWLEGFAYRIELGWWVFAAAGAAAFTIAVFTVSYQAVKAARANPVKNLRTE